MRAIVNLAIRALRLMESIIAGVIFGLIIGLAGWLIRGARAKTEEASLQAEHEKTITEIQAEHREEVANLQGQLKQADDAQTIVNAAKEQLNEVFQATASRALKGNNEQFLQLAQQNLGTTLESAKREFDQRHSQFQELVKPLSENYGKLNPQIETLASQMQSMTAETARLSSALTDNRQVGVWGELQLRRVVELAGMTAYCDFQEQTASTNSSGRPDLVVKLPEKRAVVIDAKASTAAYMEAQQTDDDESASAALLKHANALKRQVDDLASKNYGAGVNGSLDFVVMFVPGDQFLAAALSSNPELIEYAMGKHIAIATPASLIAMLWAVANGWQQLRFAESALEIKEAGEELHSRMLTFISHYQDVGRDLNRTVTAFNRSIGSFDQRVVPQGRRFSELIAGDEDKFQLPEMIGQTPRISRYTSSKTPDVDDE